MSRKVAGFRTSVALLIKLLQQKNWIATRWKVAKSQPDEQNQEASTGKGDYIKCDDY